MRCRLNPLRHPAGTFTASGRSYISFESFRDPKWLCFDYVLNDALTEREREGFWGEKERETHREKTQKKTKL